jgi:hypothetical protein
MTRAAEDGSLARFFEGSRNVGFSSQISRLADNVTFNTARFVSQSSFINDNYVFTNNQASRNNAFFPGMLFDFRF